MKYCIFGRQWEACVEFPVSKRFPLVDRSEWIDADGRVHHTITFLLTDWCSKTLGKRGDAWQRVDYFKHVLGTEVTCFLFADPDQANEFRAKFGFS